ncbi:MAG: peptide deformylase [Dehalococcoidia bacterium]
MSVLPIRIAGDPVLRQKARKVKKIDASIQRLIDDMIETMHYAPGVGLAAPQVGVSLRVVVIQVPEEEVITLINPEIVKRSGQRRVVEGCLSVPGYIAEINRSVTVTAKGLNREGKMVRIKGEDLLAEALEHETDHINGILYIDHLESPDQLVKLEPEEGSETEGVRTGL